MTTIPDKYVQFAEELRELAIKYDLRSVSATVETAFTGVDRWQHKIGIRWEEGRHGEDANTVHLESQVHLRTSLKRDGTRETLEW